MQVVIKKAASIQGVARSVGDVLEMSEGEAKAWISNGVVAAAKADKPKKATNRSKKATNKR